LSIWKSITSEINNKIIAEKKPKATIRNPKSLKNPAPLTKAKVRTTSTNKRKYPKIIEIRYSNLETG
jgi:hypothetical protein